MKYIQWFFSLFNKEGIDRKQIKSHMTFLKTCILYIMGKQILQSANMNNFWDENYLIKLAKEKRKDI